jgi:hypothetical protein
MLRTSEITKHSKHGLGNNAMVIDMGGSAVKAAAILKGKIVKERSWRHNYRDCGLELAKSNLLMNLKEICPNGTDLVGLGIAGLLSKDGTLFGSTVVTSFAGFNIGQFLAEEFGAIAYSQDNDADCGAIGEHHYAQKELLYVVVGSGIGSACVNNKSELLYSSVVDNRVPFAEEKIHPISDIGLKLTVPLGDLADMFVKIGIVDHGLPVAMGNMQLGDLGSAVGVVNIMELLWKGAFVGKESKAYYRKYLKGNDEMMRDLYSERYAAKIIAHLAMKREPRSVLAYKLMGRCLGRAILKAEKILYEEHDRYFQIRLAGNIMDSKELFWFDMLDEIKKIGMKIDCRLSDAYLKKVNPNILGAYLRVNREVETCGTKYSWRG